MASTPSRQIVELKHRLSGESQEFSCRLLRFSPGHMAVLYRLPRDAQIAGLTLKAGTLSCGYFWEDRNYNIYHWLSPDCRSLGLYINIADNTSISPDRVEWRDLIVDIVITPDGACQVLDEDELGNHIPAALLQMIREQRDQLLADARKLLKEIEVLSGELLDSSL